MDHVTEFYQFMQNHVSDLSLKTPLKCDGKWHRVHVFGSKSTPITYKMTIENSFSFGYVHDFRQGTGWTWHSQGGKKLTKEEKADLKIRILKLKADGEAARIDEQKRTAGKAQRIWDTSEPATGNEYSTRKQMRIVELKQSGGMLIIPVYIDGKITSLQYIMPDGSKRFLRAGRVDGGHVFIGTIPDRGAQVIICEGYATGESIAQATGMPVCVAFNANNLAPVSRALGKKYNIRFAADNDCETIINGAPYNTGVIKAREAADAIGGAAVIVPEMNGKRCDFNDVHAQSGLDAVKAYFASNEAQPEIPEYHEETEQTESAVNDPFEILGYDMGTYYYLPASTRQLVGLQASSHTINNLLRLAPLEYWQGIYGDGESGAAKIALNASNSLMNKAHRRGTFKTEERLRGSGVWLDSGCVVYNYGTGTHDTPESSKYHYVNSSQLPDLEPPLSNKQASALYALLKLFPFERGDIAAGLVAGWLYAAPICGALPWRSHIWVTGGAGSGKTTLLEIMRRTLGRYALCFDGGSTEAGLRASMMFDSRPVIMDEAEGETQTQRLNMTSILEYARKSSRGGFITKAIIGGGGYVNYACRGMFCFSAINPVLREGADESRITLITMKRRDDRAAYQRILDAIDALFTPDYTGAFIARSIANAKTTLANIESFKWAGSMVLGSKSGMRGADQVGTMLAGLYGLHSTKRISKEDALAWMEKQDFGFVVEQTELQDHERLLERICAAPLRAMDGSRSIDGTIGRYIAAAFNEPEPIVCADAANKALRSIGIACELYPEKRIYIANSCTALHNILRDTPWSAKWARPLLEFDGARAETPRYFTTGMTQRCVSLPYGVFRGTSA